MSQLSAVLLWRGHREDLKFPASFCDPSYLLLWACAPALGELTSSGYGFSRMLASVWQSGQIHALGITLVFFEAALVKKRFYSKLLPALGNTESSNVWDNTGYWAALIPYSSGASGPRAKSPERSGTFLSFVQCFFRHLESCLTDFAASQPNFVPRDCLIYNALFLFSCDILFYSYPFSWVLQPGDLCFSCHPTQKSNFKQKTDLPAMRDDPVCVCYNRHPKLFLLCWSCAITLLRSSSE